MHTVAALGRHFGTVVRCEVLPDPVGVKIVNGEWVVDCEHDYARFEFPKFASVTAATSTTYKYIIDNGVLQPTHPIYTRVGGYKVVAFLEMYYQNWLEFERLSLVCMQLNVGQMMFRNGGNVAKTMKADLDSSPNQQAAQKYRDFFNECYKLLTEHEKQTTIAANV